MWKDGQKVKRDLICSWDPYNNVIISETNGSVKFESVIEGVTYRDEADEQTGHREKWLSKQKIKPNFRRSSWKRKDKKTYNPSCSDHISLLNQVMM